MTDEGDLSPIVSEYEEKAFKGPSSVVVDTSQTVYFTDSGHFGVTTLQNPNGSVNIFCHKFVKSKYSVVLSLILIGVFIC